MCGDCGGLCSLVCGVAGLGVVLVVVVYARNNVTLGVCLFGSCLVASSLWCAKLEEGSLDSIEEGSLDSIYRFSISVKNDMRVTMMITFCCLCARMYDLFQFCVSESANVNISFQSCYSVSV